MPKHLKARPAQDEREELQVRVLPSDMVDNSINLSKPISGWFIRSGQIRQAFSSPSEAPFELFCEFIHPFPMT